MALADVAGPGRHSVSIVTKSAVCVSGEAEQMGSLVFALQERCGSHAVLLTQQLTQSHLPGELK